MVMLLLCTYSKIELEAIIIIIYIAENKIKKNWKCKNLGKVAHLYATIELNMHFK